MLTREEIQGKWDQLKGQIREKWGQITDDELQQANGDTERLYGLLQSKTGETRRAVESFVSTAVRDGQSMFEQAKDAAAGYVGQASETLRDSASQAAEMMSERYQQIGEQVESGVREAKVLVRNRPVESVAVAFGIGILAGVISGILLRSPSR